MTENVWVEFKNSLGSITYRLHMFIADQVLDGRPTRTGSEVEIIAPPLFT